MEFLLEGVLSITWQQLVMYAVGVILDGEAGMPGKVERGARYNSVSNYVYIKSKVIKTLPFLVWSYPKIRVLM